MSTEESPRKLVLLIDDDPDIRLAVGEVLRLEGLDVDFAGDGEEGIQRLRAAGQRVPDLILLDMSMPGADGAYFLNAKRASPELPKVPIVVMSASGWSASDEKFGGQVSGVLSKPIEIDDLVETVKRYCA